MIEDSLLRAAVEYSKHIHMHRNLLCLLLTFSYYAPRTNYFFASISFEPSASPSQRSQSQDVCRAHEVTLLLNSSPPNHAGG